MPPFRLRNLEPHIVLNDIFKNDNNIAKRKNIVTAVNASWTRSSVNSDSIHSDTCRRMIKRRTRSTQDVPLVDNKSDVLNVLIHRDPTMKKVVATKTRGRPPKVKKDIIVSAIMKKKDDILRANGKLVSMAHPAWICIKEELEYKVGIGTIYKTAKREDVYKMLSNEDKKNITCVPTENTAVVAEPTEPTGGENITTLFEHTLSNLIKTLDSLTNEIKELRKDLRQRNNSTK